MSRPIASFFVPGQTDPAIFAGLQRCRGGDHSEGLFYQWTIGITLSGGCRWRYPGGEIEMDTSTMLLVRPETPTSWRVPAGGAWHVLSIVFHPRPHWHNRMGAHDFHAGVARLNLEDAATAARIRLGLLGVERIYRRKMVQRDEWALAALERVLLTINSQSANQALGLDARLHAAMQTMHRRFDEPLSMPDIAAAAHISVSHLSSLFSRQMGMAPMRYLERVRLERAEAMLRFSSLSITEIALAVGYQDSNYFTRRFRAHAGITPREFRKDARSTVFASEL